MAKAGEDEVDAGAAHRDASGAADLEPAVVRTVREVRGRVTRARHGGAVVGLVPTMGALHAGHLSLVREAAAHCDQVVVSVFVNPTQFNDPRDLARYPRDLAADAGLAYAAGAHIVFAPPVEEIYPDGCATTVHVAGPAEGLEGAQRGPGHFDGVATVVTALLSIVAPDVAYFGRKDAQQVAVVRRLVADLHLPVRIATGETVREPDGLALSSRNVLLSSADRGRATLLSRALAAARDVWLAGERDAGALTKCARRVLDEHDLHAEYVAVADADTFRPIEGPVTTPAVLALAARVGDVRLIDNVPLVPRPASGAATEKAPGTQEETGP